MKNNLTEIILKYAQEENTDYALLLTGKWGCGKTYYWKNILSEGIKKISVSDDSETKLKPIYVSLNGISDVNQIVDRFLAEGDSSGFLKIIKYLPQNIKISFVDIDISKYSSFGIHYLLSRYLKNESQKLFVCFDDLERISIGIDEVLGFINTHFIEHNHIKTIFLTDLTKNQLTEDDNNEILEKYFERTIKFEFDAEYIIRDISLNYKNSEKPFFDFLVRNKKYIVDLIIDAKIENIRTIKFAIRILKDVFNKAGGKELNKLSKEIILFTFSVSNEFKKGRITSEESDNPKIFTNVFLYTHKLGLYNIINDSSDIPDALDNESFKYWDYFYKKYITEKRKNDFNFINSIYQYVLLGMFDKVLFEKDIENILGVTTKWDDIYNKLYEFRVLSNKEFKSYYKAVLKYVEAGQYNLYKYLNIFVLMNTFLKNNLLVISGDKLMNSFNKGLEIKSLNGFDEYSEESFRHMNRYENIKEEDFIQIRDKVIDIHNHNKHDNIEKNVMEYFEAIKDGEDKIYKYYRRIESKPIISTFSAEKLLKLITEAEHSLLVSIEDFISYHGKNIKDGTFNDDDKKKEKIELELLLTRLKQYEETLNIKNLPVTKYNIKKIIKSINEILQFNHQINPPN